MLASENINSSLRLPVVPNDTVLAGLTMLLDPVQVQEALQATTSNSEYCITDCRILYIRHKPTTNCLASYAITLRRSSSGETTTLRYYGKAYTSNDYLNASQKIGQHRLISSAGIEPVIALDKERVIFYLYLNDRSLPGLRILNDARKLVRILHDILPDRPRSEWRISDKKLRTTLLRYKPEKRAVSRIKSRIVSKVTGSRGNLTLYVRSYCDHRGAGVYSLMKQLRTALADNPELVVPQAVAYLESTRLLFMEAFDGKTWLPSNDNADSKAGVVRAARALARLHQLDRIDVPARTIDDLLNDARATAESVVLLMPRLGPAMASLLKALAQCAERTAADGPTMVHGDFYYDQVLFGDDVDAILDFDRSYRGDPSADVGNFCAHLRLLGLQGQLSHWDDLTSNFISKYEATAGKVVDPGRVRFWTAYGLLLLVVLPFRTAQPDWPEQAEAAVDVCRELLS